MILKIYLDSKEQRLVQVNRWHLEYELNRQNCSNKTEKKS